MKVPTSMWTMVAENRYNRTCLHIASDSFITFCGRDDMLVRDYVEFHNGELKKVGESRQLYDIPEWNLCKRCLKIVKKNEI